MGTWTKRLGSINSMLQWINNFNAKTNFRRIECHQTIVQAFLINIFISFHPHSLIFFVVWVPREILTSWIRFRKGTLMSFKCRLWLLFLIRTQNELWWLFNIKNAFNLPIFLSTHIYIFEENNSIFWGKRGQKVKKKNY